MVERVSRAFLILFLVLLSSQASAFSVENKNNVPKGIKLTNGSLAQLESFQKNQKKDPNKPFKLEMICFKQKKKKVLGSGLRCKTQRVIFTEQ